MAEALIVGHICLDIIPELSADVNFTPGRLVEAGPATLCTGGAVANTGVALARLGMVDVRLLGKVGDDHFGRTIRDILGGFRPGLGDSLLGVSGESTSYTIVLAPPGQDRMFLHDPGCNATFSEADVPDAALARAQLMHFGYPTLMPRMYRHHGEELVRLFQRAKAHGLFTSLDMTVPDANAESGRVDWRRVLERILPYVDLFLPNVEELSFMLDGRSVERTPAAGDPAYRRLAGETAAMGAKLAGVKAGSEGFYLATSPREGHSLTAAWPPGERWVPPFEVAVQGTTGAGDATIAGLLMGLMLDLSPDEALDAAAAAGACCCERPDAASGIRPWPEIRDRIAAGWPGTGTTGSIHRGGVP